MIDLTSCVPETAPCRRRARLNHTGVVDLQRRACSGEVGLDLSAHVEQTRGRR